jgi:hypothetical protein
MSEQDGEHCPLACASEVDRPAVDTSFQLTEDTELCHRAAG